MNIIEFFQGMGFMQMTWQQGVMLLVSFFLLYLAIHKKYEPLLLLPIAFGMLLTNLPGAGMFHDELWTAFLDPNSPAYHSYGAILKGAGLLDVLYIGVKAGVYPCLIFIGVGAMTDFGPLIANPKSLILGAAAQIGIFVTFLCANWMGFTPAEAGSIGIIGIALILSLATGINEYIDNIQEETLSSYPLEIMRENTDTQGMIEALMKSQNEYNSRTFEEDKVYSNTQVYDMFNSFNSSAKQINNMKDFRTFLENDSVVADKATSIGYSYDVKMPVFTESPSGEIVKEAMVLPPQEPFAQQRVAAEVHQVPVVDVLCVGEVEVDALFPDRFFASLRMTMSEYFHQRKQCR